LPRWLRWLLVLPAVWVAWTAAIWIGLVLHGLVDRWCPPELVVSGMCTASWYPMASKAVVGLGAAIAAALIVTLGTFVAPPPRDQASRRIFIAGSVVALALGTFLGTWLEGVCAIVVGAIVAHVFARPRPQSQRSDAGA
jgi:MFS family permease